MATHAPCCPDPAGLPAEDWHVLFAAVNERLQRSAQASLQADGLAPERAWLGAQVMDCVQALALLQRQAEREQVCQQQQQQALAQALADSQAALAQAHRDLLATRAGERRALHLAHHDSLTRLPNRASFHRRLNHDLMHPAAAPQGPVLAVLFLDLDGLKPINDHHGHHAGDELLRIVAARLARAVRREDMVCRLGGDEFACLLSQVLSREQLSHLACKLFDTVSAPLKIGALELTVRPSIGIAVCPTDGETADELLRSADSAMYRAKRRQLGYAFFDLAHDAPRTV